MSYISEQLANPGAASKLYGEIEKAILNILDFPMAYPDCRYYLISDKNIRHIVVDHYILIYEVVEEEKDIRLLRFLYSGMNISAMPTT